MNKILLGLTGGIASGKSTVSNMLKSETGFLVIDFDKLAAELREKDFIQESLIKEFGTFDRLELRKIVFGDKEKLHKLNRLFEEPLLDLAHDRTLDAAMDNSVEVIVHDCPLLLDFPDTFIPLPMSQIIVVHCPREVRLARLLERPDMTLEIAQHIIGAQISDNDRRTAANKYHAIHIENEGAFEQLQNRVREVIALVRG